MSRKKMKLQERLDDDMDTAVVKSDLDAQEETLMSRVEQFSLTQIDVNKETTDLQSSLEELRNKYIAREESFHSTVKDFQAYCTLRSEKMEEDANQLRTAAEAEAAALIAEAKKEISAWEAEKSRLSVLKTFEPKIKLDVGGNRFTTSLTTLRRFPDTMIGAMFSGRHAFHLDEEGYYFIDRDGTHFRYILNFLRSPETFVCELTGAGLKELKSECDYYGILDIMIPPIPCPNTYGNGLMNNEDRIVLNTVVLVANAGVLEVNGEYHFTDMRFDAGFYTRRGRYMHQDVKFTLYKCSLKNGGFQWFLSITPDDKEPGTTCDLDFYFAQAKPEDKLPPAHCWRRMYPDPQGISRDPAPLMTCLRPNW